MFRTYTGPVAIILTFLAVTLLTAEDAQALDIDLEPINFTFSPEYPIRGEGLEISFEVVNNGIEPAENVKIVVWNSTSECDFDDECIPIYESTEAFIEQTKKAVIEFTCNPEGPDGCGGIGDRVLTIAVDYEDDINETNEDNNRIVHEFTIYSEGLANLKGLEGDFTLVTTPANPAEGDNVDILVMFENAGRADCSDFYIEFRQILNGTTSTIELVQMRIILGQGETAQYNITWFPDEVGDYTIEVFLDPDEQVEELSENDNIFSIPVTIRAHTSELTLDDPGISQLIPMTTGLICLIRVMLLVWLFRF